MRTKYGHLTYCSNIHPGESWSEHFLQLKENLPLVRKNLSPNAPMGIGLRLGNEASLELIKPSNIYEFQTWLKNEGFYVFLINGFPYGNFHKTTVKENVYKPDWTTNERLDYTLRLFSILSQLLPKELEGGVSTPPISYQFFDITDFERKQRVRASTQNIIKILHHLIQVQMDTGQVLHLDMEPEPDGILGNVELWIQWYLDVLLPTALPEIQSKWGFTKEATEGKVKNHIRICLDVCHSAVSFEKNKTIVWLLKENLIQIGRIQISSALKAKFSKDPKPTLDLLSSFDEPTYLHQVIIQSEDGQLVSFSDLPYALLRGARPFEEWRIHFHVPVFLDSFGMLSSTQSELIEILNLQKDFFLTNSLEVETYTWGVLPKELQTPIVTSIIRELQWVKSILESETNLKVVE
ncbi:metabolite traffic protein EboE [Leptospira sp. 2 VSF19]|uniref:Metabolite traffic protein EboE n=1 Tax=Leptospira soteropolitanensis TaxID=2950025 RepID=A0AAW5VIK9_9LEPT|nr:metabolite traffic protein EboE [Leptospira soteropolitanensis]MCW7493608.1 metabolite traffic protein EboE [Leptospira soteropolitanensis]MCW7501207.1 metabolite traffic protein EboE [Leptospira soteropolitanensis]MCW7523607.1 metabolite traffic protein EboE [Leptospira soteropolitanensis]MCW7527320.1 metabolite traffic protein EboE [Leptospira soteropolitanensis]MCW7531177.1 metabolite traffic protein EboE [Leptospira soteropolitanensis]